MAQIDLMDILYHSQPRKNNFWQFLWVHWQFHPFFPHTFAKIPRNHPDLSGVSQLSHIPHVCCFKPSPIRWLWKHPSVIIAVIHPWSRGGTFLRTSGLWSLGLGGAWQMPGRRSPEKPPSDLSWLVEKPNQHPNVFGSIYIYMYNIITQISVHGWCRSGWMVTPQDSAWILAQLTETQRSCFNALAKMEAPLPAGWRRISRTTVSHSLGPRVSV